MRSDLLALIAVGEARGLVAPHDVRQAAQAVREAAPAQLGHPDPLVKGAPQQLVADGEAVLVALPSAHWRPPCGLSSSAAAIAAA